MNLSAALRLSHGEVVAFVGGGGKTTAMFRLADEIVAAGGRAVTTTTTRIFAAQIRLAPAHGQSLAEVKAALARSPHVLITGAVDSAEGKAAGIEPELVSALRGLPGVAAVLVEADGSRMRPLKAPADHEPVIPESATLVVPLAGIDAVGKLLTDRHVHRPDAVARLAAVEPGSLVTPEVLAAVLAHPLGGRKGVPPGARIIPLINKVEGDLDLARATHAADILLREPEVRAAAVGAVASPSSPVRACWGRAAAVLLAAGESSRMGELKQLLRWRDTTLVGHVADAALASTAAETVVVVGAGSDRVAAALAGRPVRTVFNSRWQEGQSESVRAGLAALPANVDAALFLLTDQPRVTPGVIDALVERWRSTLAPVVAPRVEGRRANPVLFDRAAWPDLTAVEGDVGGRALFDAYRDRIEWVDWDASIVGEADTPEEYQALRDSEGS